MMSQVLSRRQSTAASRLVAGPHARPARAVRAQLFRRDGPVAVEEGAVEEYNQPTKRQREQIKRTLQDLGFTEQAADILAYGKVTNSNADLLIGDIRASFGIYQPPPPQGPVETVQSGVQDLLDRLKLPFLGLVLAAGLTAAALSQRELLGSLSLPPLPALPGLSDGGFDFDFGGVSADLADTISFAVDDAVQAVSGLGLPGLNGDALAPLQDALDDFLFDTLQR